MLGGERGARGRGVEMTRVERRRGVRRVRESMMARKGRT